MLLVAVGYDGDYAVVVASVEKVVGGYIVVAVFVVVAVEGNLGGSVDRYPVDFIVVAVLGFVVKVKIVKNS